MKKITLTTEQVLMGNQVLKKLFESDKLTSLKTKFRLNLIVDSVDEIGREFAELNKKLVLTYGNKKEVENKEDEDQQDDEFIIPKERMEDFISDRNDILSKKHEIEFLPLQVSLLEKDEVTTDLTAKEIKNIWHFIEDDTE